MIKFGTPIDNYFIQAIRSGDFDGGTVAEIAAKIPAEAILHPKARSRSLDMTQNACERMVRKGVMRKVGRQYMPCLQGDGVTPLPCGAVLPPDVWEGTSKGRVIIALWHHGPLIHRDIVTKAKIGAATATATISKLHTAGHVVPVGGNSRTHLVQWDIADRVEVAHG